MLGELEAAIATRLGEAETTQCLLRADRLIERLIDGEIEKDKVVRELERLIGAN